MKKFDFNSFMRQGLRRLSYKFPPRSEALRLARIERGKYKCESCSEIFGPKEIDVDHRAPVIDPEKGFQNWNIYIKRLFCAVDGYSILCKECHKAKSFLENEIRREVKNEK